MNSKNFEKIFNHQHKRCKEVLINKASEYATEDRLHNFKVAAALEGTTPVNALGGMLAKHTVSLFDMCRGTAENKQYPLAMWEEKITDHLNYLYLLRALIEDTNAIEWPSAQ